MLNLTFVNHLKILLSLALVVTLAPAIAAPTSSEAAGVLVICTSIKSGRSMVSKTGKCRKRLYEARNWYAVGKVPVGTPRSKIISITVCTSKKYKSQLIRSKCNYRTQLSTKYQRRIGPPSAPQVPTINAKSLGTASLRLTPPEDDGGAAIKSYMVTAHPGDMTYIVKPDNAKNVKITGLTPGLTYTFTVTATNSQGVSDSSRHTPHMMAPNVPSSPKISSIFLTGRNSARITYSQPESDGASEITDYTAVLVPGDIPIASRQISTGILEVWGLPYSTTHTISLIAHNSFGPSPASAGSPSITTQALPQTLGQTPSAETAPEPTPTAEPIPESATPATTLSSSKVISLFSFKDLSPPVDASIDEGAGAITATVPCSTNLSTLVATFTHSSSSAVTVNAVEQTSGIVINDYTVPLEFLVTAADSSTKRYIVSVTREPCTITYDANGGAGQPTPQTKIDGVTLSLSSVLPTRSGYTFNGWNTADNGSGTTFAAGASYSLEEDVALYAQWSANTLTITYDVNGSSLPSGGSSTSLTGGTISTLSTVEFPGYTFTGWFTTASGGIKITTDSPHNQTENFTLYAQGTANTLVITYDANGGATPSGGSATTVTNGSIEALATTSYIGYTFTGWFTAASGGTQITTSAGHDQTSNFTLYAQWVLATYYIAFDVNGGSSPRVVAFKTHGTAISASSDIPTRTGYTFTGWNTAADGSGNSYAAGASYAAEGDATLYAQWSANTLTITYDANGGATPSGGSATTVTGGSIATLATTSYTNWTFNGWFTAASGGTQITTSAGHNQTSKFTLYAQWTGSYSLGDTGPGGGKIFYVSAVGFDCGISFNSTGSPTGSKCHFLEGAPKNWATETTVNWAHAEYANVSVPDSRNTVAIGSGYRNTLAIINQGNSDQNQSAAAFARSYTVVISGQTFNDWYLPSKDEAYQLMVTRTTVMPTNPGQWIKPSANYWTSTETKANEAFWVSGSDASIMSWLKYSSGTYSLNYVRPIRAF